MPRINSKLITTDLHKAAEALKQNNIVAIPTETVYGLAANAFEHKAIEKIFSLKKRPFYNPLIVHIKSAEYLNHIAKDIPEIAFRLATEFWPGPLTLVLNKRSIVPDIITAGKNTVAVRMPNHPITLELLNSLDFPLAAPSANPFGSISPTTAGHVSRYFGGNLEVVLDGGECLKGIESTIIGFEGEQAVLYRLGSISAEDLERVVGKLKHHTVDDSAPAAPGMLSRHYAPSTETLLTQDIKEMVLSHPNKKIGLLIFQENPISQHVAHTEVLSQKGDLNEAARNLYAAMHRLDHLDLDVIIAEKLPEEGLGKSINDRLKRAVKKQL
ncbi:MAG: L-threonylcarbamoyladenylate synthase [Flavobacteriales bacterium]